MKTILSCLLLAVLLGGCKEEKGVAPAGWHFKCAMCGAWARTTGRYCMSEIKYGQEEDGTFKDTYATVSLTVSCREVECQEGHIYWYSWDTIPFPAVYDNRTVGLCACGGKDIVGTRPKDKP